MIYNIVIISIIEYICISRGGNCNFRGSLTIIIILIIIRTCACDSGFSFWFLIRAVFGSSGTFTGAPFCRSRFWFCGTMTRIGVGFWFSSTLLFSLGSRLIRCGIAMATTDNSSTIEQRRHCGGYKIQ